LLARLLNPAGYGTYTMLVLAGTYASVLLSEWITYSYQRFHSLTTDGAAREAAGQANSWRLIQMAIGTVVMVPIILVLGFNWQTALSVVAVAWATSSFQYRATDLMVREQSSAYTRLQILVSVAKLGAVLIAVLVLPVPELAAIATAFATIAVLLASRELRGVHRPAIQLSRAAFAQLAGYGFPMLLSSVALNALASADRYIVALIAGTAEAGRYAAAYLLGEQAILLVSSVLFLSSYPRVMIVWERGNREEAGSLAASIAGIHMQLVIPVVVVLIVLSRQITDLALGRAYASPLVPPLVGAGLALLVLTQYVNLGAQMQRRPRVLALQLLAAAALNIALCILFVPKMGGVGAAWATLGSYAAAVVMAVVSNRTVFPIARVFKSVRYALLIAAIGVTLGHFATSPLQVTTALMVYLGAALSLGFIAVRRGLREGELDPATEPR
jgi:O-antigen/teichoic acid export membrane protein